MKTNRQVAKDLISYHVLEYGESIEQIRKSRIGHCYKDFNASVGGWINKKYHNNKIFVKQNGEEEIFSLKDIYDEVKKD